MTLSLLLEKYRALLNTFWLDAAAIAEEAGGDEWLNDWKQANWELIVEGGLAISSPVILLPYGEGADFYGNSSRILSPKAIPTHAVRGRPIAAAIDILSEQSVEFPADGLILECFVTVRDGWYYEEPPFDSVLFIKDNIELVFPLQSIEFLLGSAMTKKFQENDDYANI